MVGTEVIPSLLALSPNHVFYLFIDFNIMHTIVVAGGERVGKSSLTQRFVRGEWLVNGRVNTSESDVYFKQMKLGDDEIPLAVVDTASSTTTTGVSYPKGDAFILVFSISDKESFNDLKDVRNSIIKERGTSVPITIVGNKCDLENQRQVESNEAYNLANTWSASGTPTQYIEASAKEDCNTFAIFRHSIEAIKTSSNAIVDRLVCKPITSSKREKVKRRQGIRRALVQMFLTNRLA